MGRFGLVMAILASCGGTARRSATVRPRSEPTCRVAMPLTLAILLGAAAVPTAIYGISSLNGAEDDGCGDGDKPCWLDLSGEGETIAGFLLVGAAGTALVFSAMNAMEVQDCRAQRHAWQTLGPPQPGELAGRCSDDLDHSCQGDLVCEAGTCVETKTGEAGRPCRMEPWLPSGCDPGLRCLRGFCEKK